MRASLRAHGRRGRLVAAPLAPARSPASGRPACAFPRARGSACGTPARRRTAPGSGRGLSPQRLVLGGAPAQRRQPLHQAVALLLGAVMSSNSQSHAFSSTPDPGPHASRRATCPPAAPWPDARASCAHAGGLDVVEPGRDMIGQPALEVDEFGQRVATHPGRPRSRRPPTAAARPCHGGPPVRTPACPGAGCPA